MRKGRRIKYWSRKLAPIGLALVLAGCSAGGGTQSADTAKEQTAGQPQDTAQEQEVEQPQNQTQAAIQIQDPQTFEWGAEDELRLPEILAAGRVSACRRMPSRTKPGWNW